MLKKIFDVQNRTPDLLEKARLNYSFQANLTKELDSIDDDFDEVTFLKIVLWKTNRYPELAVDTLRFVNDLRRRYTDAKARKALLHLLNLRGFDLPMASTILRFACPNELQIIDKRVYRFIMPEDELKIPYSNEKKVDLYFEYINRLKIVAKECNVPFSESDRIFYQLDKNLNSATPINY